MGLFDAFNAMVDTVKTTVEAGKELYHVQELVNEIMESADSFTDEYTLTEEDTELYDAWVAVHNEAVDAEGDEKSKLEDEALKKALVFIQEYQNYDDVSEEIKGKCAEAIDGYTKVKGDIAGLFNKYTDDEEAQEKIRQAVDESM